ncbi:MAG: Gfo/Idh/MocA family oxidoreductase [Planctomycetota bacterium]
MVQHNESAFSPSSQQVGRRQVGRRSVLTGAAAAAASLFAPGPVFGLNAQSYGANERVRLAMIGCGVRGSGLAMNLPEGSQLVSAVDAVREKAGRLAEQLDGEVSVDDDYRTVLERTDLDGVLICTTDHHHAHAGVLASQAGIDSYIEKPLTFYFSEGRALVDAARRHNRVVQVGTQQRSMEMNRFACELVRDGGIGDVKVVEMVNYSSAKPLPAGGQGGASPPAGINWDAWIGPAPMRAFRDDLIAHWSDGKPNWWGTWREYTVGQIGGMGAHALDMVQYALGTDDTGPVELWPVGPDAIGVPRVDFRYANGVEVRLVFLDKRPYRGPRLGGVFTGSKCKIEINRNKYRTNPVDFAKEAAPDPALAKKWEGPGWIARGHIEEWLDAIKTRRRPNTDIEIGHRVSTISHLVDITRAVNRRLVWDPEREVFPHDPEAQQLLTRPRREGWELPS